MRCASCSFENRPEVKFCENCGQPLPRVCQSCGEPVPTDAKYCGNCGTPLLSLPREGRDSTTPPITQGAEKGISDRLAALRRSAPTALKEKMRAASAQIEGERKPVTILFTDIVGSTPLAEKLDPEDWKDIVCDAHDRVSKAVYRYEGTIAQLLGDGVLAFFGAPITHEDDPVRAVKAGLDIQRSIADYSRTLKGYADNFQMRIGINTGIVVVGSIGSDMHMEYLAIGDSVNLAARLQSAAQPGTVLISEATARLVKAEFELNSLGEISVKGRAEPVVVYEVLETKTIPAARSGRGIKGLTSPLVGRDKEKGTLREAIAGLLDGHGQIVALIGEAGIGKSRLVEEVRRERGAGMGRHGEADSDSESPRLPVPVSPLTWLEGRSLSYGQTLSLWAITQLVKADLGLPDADPEAKIRSALRRRTNALFAERVPEVMPYLAHLLGIKLEGDMAERVRVLDGETLKRQILLSISEYFACIAKERPTVLVFEDMHWADPSTLEALGTLLLLTDHVPLMILMLMRPERDHGSWRLKLQAETDFAHRYVEINLMPLSSLDSNQLVNNLLEIAEIPPGIRSLILERSEGNPFYLEEIIRSLIEQGAIVHEDHHWRATKEIAKVAIPETLQGVLLARIDRLEEDVRRTLQLASVIGKSFLYRLLEAIAQAERELDRHLAQLQRVDLVREKTRRPELEYIFKHSLTQEAAYNSLLVERRKEFHRQVGAALEQLFAERKEEFYGLLAHHFDAGGERERAVDYLLKAGDKARLEDAQEEAAKFYKRAVELLSELGDYRRAAQTWLKLGLVYHTNFQFQAAHHANEMAFALQQKARGLPKVMPRMDQPIRVVRLLVDSNIRTVDPGKVTFSNEAYIARNLFSGLAEIDAELNVVPDVAKSWEVLDDGTRYVFHLRDDVRWTDGTPVTARDFEWAWKRNLAPATGAGLVGQLNDVVGARDYHEGRVLDPESVGVKALGALTLEVRLESPVAYFPYVFAQPLSFPLPRHVVERYGDEWCKPEHFVSNGAYRLTEFGTGGIVLERNASYFGEMPGNVDRFEARVIVDRHEQMSAFLRGEGDIVYVFRQDIPSGLENAVVEEPGNLSLQYIIFNPLCPPLGDIRVRRALIHATDRERAASVRNAVLATGGLVPVGMPGHTPGLGVRYDPSAAQRLLAEAGYPGGSDLPRLRFEIFRASMELVEEIARQWREVLGVEVEVKEMPPGTTLPSDPATHVAGFGWNADYPDPDNFLRQAIFYGEFLKMGVLDPRYAELVEAAARARDRSQRMAMYREADRIITMDQVLIVPFSYGMRDSCVVIQPWIKRFSISPLDWPPIREFSVEPH